jgi:hypothetical protein
VTGIERLRAIVKVFRDCDEEPTREAVAEQFRYETRQAPFPQDLDRALAPLVRPCRADMLTY